MMGSNGGNKLSTALAIGSLMATSLTYMLGVSMIRPILALYFDSVGYAALMIGIFVAMNALFPILLGMPIGSRIDRMGTRRAVVTGSAICLLSGLLCITGVHWESIVLVLSGQVLNGIGGMFCWGALQTLASLTANQSSQKRSNHLISNFSFVNSMGQLVGPSMGGFLSDYGGYAFVFYVFCAFNACSIVLASVLPIGSFTQGQKREQAQPAAAGRNKDNDSDVSDNSGKGSFWQSYKDGYTLVRKNKPFAIAIMLNGILFMLIDVRVTFFPLFLSGTGLSHTEIGSMLSISALAALIVRPLTGHLMNWLGHRKIMLISIFSGAVCLLLLMLKPEYWVLTLIVFIWGSCTSVNQPVALMMIAHTVQPSERGMGMSLRTMSNRFVQLTNPVLFGALTTVIGLSLGFGALGVLLLAFGVVYQRQSGTQPASQA
jgi:MFS family permease